MNSPFLRNRTGIFFTLYLLLIVAVLFRMLPYYLNTPYAGLVIGLLAVYLVLLVTERWVSARFTGYAWVYFPLQMAIPVALFIIPSFDAPLDYFTNLVLPLSGQAVWNLPSRTAARWVAAFCIFCVLALQIPYPGMEGVNFSIAYIAGAILISSMIAMTKRADQARQESQALLSELKLANTKLQEYAVQVERLAAAEERNRLARELHDSVSQTIFSMTLTAQSARILLERDPARVPGLLDHIQTLAQNALAEMRSLIEKLRPPPVLEKNLESALRSHLEERKLRDGLLVTLQIDGHSVLPPDMEDGLFRIVQEAINNVVKHAGVKEAAISLVYTPDTVSVSIEDNGAGFDPTGVKTMPGHFGLASMDERVRALGGSLKIESIPGKGTRITAMDIPIITSEPVQEEPDPTPARPEEDATHVQ